MSGDSLRRLPGVVLVLHVLCFWPVWRWYAARMTDGSDEPWGIAALAAALLLTWSKARSWTLRPDDKLLWAAALLTFVYAIAVPFAPPLVRAAVAMCALACSWVSVANLRGKLAPVIVLFALSLPVIASLQFYCGYPLRSITTAGSALTLDLLGFEVQRSGTALLWQGQTVLVDAPCSGIRMLWTGTALACVMALHRDSVGWRSLTILLLLAGVAALFANVLRAAALFTLETRGAPAPELVHTSVGVATFVVTALLIVAIEALLVPGEKNRGNSAPQQIAAPLSFRSFLLPAPVILCAALAPALSRDESNLQAALDVQPRWPSHFQGRMLSELPLSARESEFLSGFPGAVARFTDGERDIVMRWVTQPTRRLHPAEDCYRGLGYSVSTPRIVADNDGGRWRCFAATRKDAAHEVCEQLQDLEGRRWTDVSAWYWAAVLERSRGPWLVTTAATP